MVRSALLAGCGLIALGGSALATDLTPVVYAPHPIAGYLELRGGFDSGKVDGTYQDPGPYDYEWSWSGGFFGGAARAAVMLSSAVSVQGDVWGDAISVSETHFDSCCGTETFSKRSGAAGLGGHLTWHTAGGQLLGVFASVGTVSDSYFDWNGTLGTVGAEAAYNAANWRFYGQTGLTSGIGGDPLMDSSRYWYLRGVIARYFTPNLVLSGNVGFDTYTDTTWGGTRSNGVVYGARLEYKPDTLPVSGFLGFQGWCWNGSNNFPDEWKGSESVFVVGLRALFNGSSLQQMDMDVGLFDMNAAYGEVFVH